METMTNDAQPLLDLRQYPRLRVPAPFACSFIRRGLTKWIRGDHEGLGIVFDVSLKGAKVMSETSRSLAGSVYGVIKKYLTVFTIVGMLL